MSWNQLLALSVKLPLFKIPQVASHAKTVQQVIQKIKYTEFIIGTYSNIQGAEFCSNCNPGSYSTEKSPSCSSCSAGTFQADSGKASCDDCPIGTMASSTGATACVDCAKGTYAENPKTINCVDCPAGTYQSEKGKGFCIDCQKGYFSSTKKVNYAPLVPRIHTPIKKELRNALLAQLTPQVNLEQKFVLATVDISGTILATIVKVIIFFKT